MNSRIHSELQLDILLSQESAGGKHTPSRKRVACLRPEQVPASLHTAQLNQWLPQTLCGPSEENTWSHSDRRGPSVVWQWG